MARGVNKITLLGNITKDPEVKYTPSGGAVASFGIATSEAWTDKATGQKKEQTQFHNCTAFNRLAEIVGEYCKKGSQVYAEGSVKYESWDDAKTGEKKYMTKIIVRDVHLLGGRSQGDGSGQQQAPQRQAELSTAGGDFSDDIPFAQFSKGMAY